MFTGIIQHVGRVASVRSGPSGQGGGLRLAIDVGPLAEGPAPLLPGASLAVNGVCLTAAAIQGARAEFDAVAETLQRTTLRRLRPGDRVNLERALRLGDGLDGHLLQGHVDALAEVRAIDKGAGWVLHLAAPPELTDLMVPKGSVALDGVSLTLVDVSGSGFRVALIPETLARTTLCGLRGGDAVNVETDILGKYVRKYLASLAPPASGAGITMEKLREAGFV